MIEIYEAYELWVKQEMPEYSKRILKKRPDGNYKSISTTLEFRVFEAGYLANQRREK